MKSHLGRHVSTRDLQILCWFPSRGLRLCEGVGCSKDTVSEPMSMIRGPVSCIMSHVCMLTGALCQLDGELLPGNLRRHRLVHMMDQLMDDVPVLLDNH